LVAGQPGFFVSAPEMGVLLRGLTRFSGVC
jgi:hypothetical protein